MDPVCLIRKPYHGAVPAATLPASGLATGGIPPVYLTSRYSRVARPEARMTDHFDMVMIGWFLFLLIGIWVLVNALIDLTAKQVRRWITERWRVDPQSVHGVAGRNRLGR